MSSAIASIHDLRPACPDCGGSKRANRPPAAPPGVGLGLHVVPLGNEPCQRCQGFGFVLTPAGRAVLDFMADPEVRRMAGMIYRPMA